jgi:putative peptidoglycan lipid II flippase
VAGLPLGPVGLAAGATLGAWLEWVLLRRALAQRIGKVGAGADQLARMFTAAALAAGAGYAVNLIVGGSHPVFTAACVAAGFGIVYLGAARAMGLGEAVAFSQSLLRRLRRR